MIHTPCCFDFNIKLYILPYSVHLDAWHTMTPPSVRIPLFVFKNQLNSNLSLIVVCVVVGAEVLSTTASTGGGFGATIL